MGIFQQLNTYIFYLFLDSSSQTSTLMSVGQEILKMTKSLSSAQNDLPYIFPTSDSCR